MNPNLTKLAPYPFEKLRRLKEGVQAPADRQHIAMSIGEPQHQPPAFVVARLTATLDTITRYSAARGLDALREAIARWATQRFDLTAGSLTAEDHVLPVSGTREGLFAFVQAVFDSRSAADKILMPNPFYQIYEGAALLAGATPYFINCVEEADYQMDFASVPEAIWRQCQLLFICTPGNPTGKVLSLQQLQQLSALAEKFDFIIASDECYSELYFDERSPPVGLLTACEKSGNHAYKRCVVFHSLSKRSNLAGLRSGFVAGDKAIIDKFLKYRTYHGCAMPIYSQQASIAAWCDETHVVHNRNLYREKFTAVLAVLRKVIAVEQPEAGFCLWLKVPSSDTEFARALFAQENITVLPGSFLARDTERGNPGANHVRLALVAPLEECLEAAERIERFLQNYR